MSINLTVKDSSLNTQPAASFNYPEQTCYFLSFLPNWKGIKYSFVSDIPNVSIKQNSKLRDVNQFYSSNFVIVKQIHAFTGVNTSDLEMIIEHTPDKNNTIQRNLYTCFGFTDASKNNAKSFGFQTLFNGVSATNINITVQDSKNATNDQLKQSKMSISLNNALVQNLSDATKLPFIPDAYYYVDNSMNIFIVFNHIIDINCPQYKAMNTVFKTVETNKIFEETDCKINKDIGGVTALPFTNLPLVSGFTTLSEGFSSLHQSFITIREGTTTLSGNEKPLYCRPSDSSNSDKLLTTTINATANIKKDSVLLNDLIMIFIIMIIFIFMCVLSPTLFFATNGNLTKYNTGYLFWLLRILAFVFIFCGGFITIIVSRTVADTPEWLPLVGLIVIICYILYYLVVYSFQKNMIYTQLSDLVEETFEESEKENIKKFRNYIFGEVI